MNLNKVQIRLTTQEDFKTIYTVEELAFGYEKEAQLTLELLNDKTARPFISLLAFYKTQAIGHILFTRAYLNGIVGDPLIHILAPLAVIPEFQKKGIGGLLIRKGLEKLKLMDSELCFVLGHINYYPKHGFINDAQQFGFPAPYPIPENVKDAWMVQELREGRITSLNGKILCSDELNKPEHWRE